jgi:hypothetical protein
LESLEFNKFFDVGLTKFKNIELLPNKIRRRLLLTTKLFIGQKILIGSGPSHKIKARSFHNNATNIPYVDEKSSFENSLSKFTPK